MKMKIIVFFKQGRESRLKLIQKGKSKEFSMVFWLN